jgi:hypothetical protein
VAYISTGSASTGLRHSSLPLPFSLPFRINREGRASLAELLLLNRPGGAIPVDGGGMEGAVRGEGIIPRMDGRLERELDPCRWSEEGPAVAFSLGRGR